MPRSMPWRTAYMTRDLTNEPANVLTTTEFADRLAEMKDLGLEVEVLEEDKLAELGMRTLLSVGQGSVSPSKVVECSGMAVTKAMLRWLSSVRALCSTRAAFR